MTINYPHLKVITALLIGHPMTKEVAGSRVTSDTSEMQVESHTSERGTWNEGNDDLLTSNSSHNQADLKLRFIKSSREFPILPRVVPLELAQKLCSDQIPWT